MNVKIVFVSLLKTRWSRWVYIILSDIQNTHHYIATVHVITSMTFEVFKLWSKYQEP